MPKRLMPTRDNLRRSHGALNASENDIAGVELMLYLIRASDVIREEIYGALRRDTGLTEGNAAVHAAAALLPLFFQRERNMELVKIFNSVFGRNRRTCLSCKL